MQDVLVPAPPVATFLYDVGSPYAYLVAERIDREMPTPIEWCPVLLGAIFQATGRSSWARTPARADGIAEVERRASERALPPVRWPAEWPNDGLLAMRLATLARAEGRGREFAIEAMRTQFRDGEPLSDPTILARVAERAELGPGAVQRASDPTIKQALREQTEAALAAGVSGVPAILCPDGELFWGDDKLEQAASHLRLLGAR